MKLIVNNNDIYDIGHDDSINEYLLYVTTDDDVIIKAFDKVYGENVLTDTIALLRKSYTISETIYIPYNKTTEEAYNEIQN
jgi:hypothetical protein